MKYLSKKLTLFIFKLFIINLFHSFNYIKIKKKKIKICLCVIGKKENLYAREFVEYYKKLGYNKICIYDNNDINDERFEEVLLNQIDEGFVSIINYRGLKAHQFNSYKNCYEKTNKKYDWISFFDFDEFLEIRQPNTKIQEFLANKRFKKCENIKINRIYYNSENLYYENKTLEKRIYHIKKIDKCIKSTVRGNLSINYWSKMINPHTSLNKFISCSSSGKIINSTSSMNDPPDIKNAFLKHYYIKSFEEFCIKRKRGYADNYNKNLNQKLKKFFEQNKNNINKIKIMKTILNISINV